MRFQPRNDRLFFKKEVLPKKISCLKDFIDLQSHEKGTMTKGTLVQIQLDFEGRGE
jgi:hypothetical protein